LSGPVPGAARAAADWTPPRVLMLCADREIDRRVLLEADALRAAGFSVRVLAPRSGDEGPAADDPPGVERVAPAARGAGPLVRALGLYRWLRGRIPGLATIVQRTAFRTLPDPFSVFRGLLEGPAVARAAEIYVAHDLPMLPIAAAAAAARGGRLVYDAHELYAEQGYPAPVRDKMIGIERRWIGSCDAVITVNRSIAEQLGRRYGLSAVHVVMNAERHHEVPPSGRLRRTLGLPPGVRIVLLQGGLSPGRNLESLAAAAPALRGRDAALVFLGDGAMVEALREIARAAGAADLVRFHPKIPQRELLDATAEAELGVIPYQPDCENNRLCTPNKLFEFIAAGVPVVATDLPELRRLVADAGIGVVGDTSSGERLGELIAGALDDGERLARWRVRVRQVARSEVDWSIEGEKLVRVYRDVLSLGPRDAAAVVADAA
jgi:glycosyltransferase involved in cell wall biosynthesis